MCFGTVGALIQRRIKRLLAYSTVTTVGYLLAGLSGGTVSLVQYTILYVFTYVMAILPIFIILLNYRVNNMQCMSTVQHVAAMYHKNK